MEHHPISYTNPINLNFWKKKIETAKTIVVLDQTELLFVTGKEILRACWIMFLQKQPLPSSISSSLPRLWSFFLQLVILYRAFLAVSAFLPRCGRRGSKRNENDISFHDILESDKDRRERGKSRRRHTHTHTRRRDGRIKGWINERQKSFLKCNSDTCLLQLLRWQASSFLCSSSMLCFFRSSSKFTSCLEIYPLHRWWKRMKGIGNYLIRRWWNEKCE